MAHDTTSEVRVRAPRSRAGASWWATWAARRRERLLRSITVPQCTLAGVMVVYAVFYVHHLNLMHDRYWTTGYDLGIFDQATWLVARGHSFITIRGLDFWGHHVNIGLLLFAPASWLGAGPKFLDAAMVVAFVLGARAVYRIAMHHLHHEWLAAVLAIAYLLQTGAQWVLHETFHPEVLAIAPMLYAYLAVLEGRWRAYAFWLVLAASWKEDVAITIAMLGLVVAWRGHRRAGAATFVTAVAYYFFCTKVLLPHYTTAGPFYSEFLGNLGDTPGELAKNMVLHPTRFTDQLQRAKWYQYPRDLAQPYAFTSFLSLPGLVLALPQMLLNLFTQHSYAWSVRWHYSSMPTVGFTIASVEGVRNLRTWASRWTRVAQPARRHLARTVAGVVLVCSVAMSIAWSPSWGVRYRDFGVWPLDPNPHVAVLERAVSLVPDDVVVAVSYNFSTHLGHRERIYEFPNPWRASYWGVDDRLPDGRVVAWPPLPDPDTVTWLAIDRGTLGNDSRTLLSAVLASGQWEILLNDEDVVVARRR